MEYKRGDIVEPSQNLCDSTTLATYLILIKRYLAAMNNNTMEMNLFIDWTCIYICFILTLSLLYGQSCGLNQYL